MEEFVSKKNFFELNGNIKQQVSGTAIDTKFATSYMYMFTEKVET